MFEAYQAYGDYHAMMDLTESLICGAIEAMGGGFVRPWGDATLDFTPPWPRRTYAELIGEYAGSRSRRISRRSRPGPRPPASRPPAKTPTSSPTSFLKPSSKII